MFLKSLSLPPCIMVVFIPATWGRTQKRVREATSGPQPSNQLLGVAICCLHYDVHAVTAPRKSERADGPGRSEDELSESHAYIVPGRHHVIHRNAHKPLLKSTCPYMEFLGYPEEPTMISYLH